jgi:cobalt-zinc-cadmium efflux system protein
MTAPEKNSSAAPARGGAPTPHNHGHGGLGGHEHGALGGHGHTHAPLSAPDGRLILSLILNLLITLAQIVGGLIANSLGLISDAAHNLSDVVALALSLWAVRLGRRPATPTRTFAYKRAEILVALFNSTVLVALCLYLVVEAIRRLLDPQPVEGLWVIGLAAGGLIINAFSAFLFRDHLHDLNLRAAFLHLVADAATSLAVIISGVAIYVWDWFYADAIVTVIISLWIGWAAFRIVKSTVNVLMEGTPESMEFSDVEAAILAVPGVRGVHDLHLWSISSVDHALSAHVVLDDTSLTETGAVLGAIKDTLARDFAIGHATLEAEVLAADCPGECPITDRPSPGPGHEHTH